ncbi:hypothetical protein V6N12_005836 [Hibiscus sabdariffa]|uniref:RNase H type-1 domain-containing protein n=1 Tax=Hibiscus sabdariffa TaxID=183260 RepID=A0ABR2EW87_9ROSI
MGRPDEIILRFDGSGCYTAKSGYRLLMDDRCGVIGRNNQGLIMAACASPHSNVVNAFVAEVIAYLSKIHVTGLGNDLWELLLHQKLIGVIL